MEKQSSPTRDRPIRTHETANRRKETAIRIENLTKYYGKIRGIEDVSFQVERGEFFGFIGPNAAGKSTTIRSLLGLIRPTSGRAWVLEKEIAQDREEILRQVGYLPAENTFYPNMRVQDLLQFSANLRKQDCSQRAAELSERLQLDTSRKVDELSSGNRKKAAIVAALQHDPELLILDEPTSSLDPLMQNEFFKILKERHTQGATIFLSTHILSEVQTHCRTAAIIRDGKIVAWDKVSNLVQAATKRIHIRGSVDLNDVQGVMDLKQMNGTLDFFYQGDLKELLTRLSTSDIKDLRIIEPSLEEVFLHYYEVDKGDKNATQVGEGK